MGGKKKGQPRIHAKSLHLKLPYVLEGDGFMPTPEEMREIRRVMSENGSETLTVIPGMTSPVKVGPASETIYEKDSGDEMYEGSDSDSQESDDGYSTSSTEYTSSSEDDCS